MFAGVGAEVGFNAEFAAGGAGRDSDPVEVGAAVGDGSSTVRRCEVHETNTIMPATASMFHRIDEPGIRYSRQSGVPHDRIVQHSWK